MFSSLISKKSLPDTSSYIVFAVPRFDPIPVPPPAQPVRRPSDGSQRSTGSMPLFGSAPRVIDVVPAGRSTEAAHRSMKESIIGSAPLVGVRLVLKVMTPGG
jgi:hypothetical protein